MNTRPITLDVPAGWYVAPDHRGDLVAWDSAVTPHVPVLPSVMERHPLNVLLLAVLPRMQWGVLGEQPLTREFGIRRFASEAQARLVQWLRVRRDVTLSSDVVHSLNGVAWDGGHFGPLVGAQEIGGVDDLTSDPFVAHAALDDAREWVASGDDPDAADHLAALRRESIAHGHDVTELEPDDETPDAFEHTYGIPADETRWTVTTETED